MDRTATIAVNITIRYGTKLYTIAVSGSGQNVIKLTPALSNPTVPVGRQIEKETGEGGGKEAFRGGREEAFH